MKLDDDLKINSKPLEAKRKGISTVGKYEFGSYKIVSGKAGWIVGTESGWSIGRIIGSESLVFGMSKSKSKQKSSFVFVGKETDTVLVNTSTNTELTEIGTEFFSVSRLNQSDENYIAIFIPFADTTEWLMSINTLNGSNNAGIGNAQGKLTNGVINIDIREVKQWADGKSPAFGVICGYEFYLDNHSIAAVQSSVDTFQKKFVWLHENLDEKMKTLLAAASASLMVHTDDAMKD